MIPVIAIFDIGKTNKKCMLFDRQYQVVWETAARIPETFDEDGFPCENLLLLTKWVQDTWKGILQLPRMEIRAVNVSAYGASLVHLDESLQPVAPLYNYLKPYPEEIRNRFDETYDKNQTLSVETASPALGNLNAGMQLYLLKQNQPAVFSRIRYSFFLPQYISFLFTKQPVTELTAIGCHTGIWDFGRKQYHEWMLRENLTELLPEIYPSGFVFPVAADPDIVCGVGIHDSSAALVPYVKALHEPFVLISTGTWSVSLSPYNQQPLTENEMAEDCLFYLNPDGYPVKASRFRLGFMHDAAVEILGVDYKSITYCPDYKNSLTANSVAHAYHELVHDLVQQQVHSTRLVMVPSVKKIYVDGGFATNEIYLNMLALQFPECDVFAASLPAASALGAAMVMHEQWNELPIPDKKHNYNFHPVSYPV